MSEFRESPCFLAIGHILASPTAPGFVFALLSPSSLWKLIDCLSLKSSIFSSAELSRSPPGMLGCSFSTAPMTLYIPHLCLRTQSSDIFASSTPCSTLRHKMPFTASWIYISCPDFSRFQVYILTISFWMFDGHLQTNIPNPVSPTLTLFSVFPVSVDKITTHSVAHAKNSKVIFHSLSLILHSQWINRQIPFGSIFKNTSKVRSLLTTSTSTTLSKLLTICHLDYCN